jgi:2-polyprenyl-3-methyl-5-hydroxy-6-metoxy-1,4-benzoquinol methylase
LGEDGQRNYKSSGGSLMDKCIICGTEGNKLFNVGKYELWKCSKCDLTWTKNFKEPDYRNYRLDSTYSNCNGLFKNIFKRIEKISRKHFKESGKVFDVGASVGTLLEIYKEKGWQVEGIEPSDQARDVAIGKGIELLPGKLEEAKVKPNHYDLILMNHTLEHVHDPDVVLKKIHSSLKSGGLLIIGVPNFGSFSAKIWRKRWPHILATEHKWHFSPKSLKLVVEKNGFTPLAHYTASGIFEFDNPPKELLDSFLGLKKRFFANLITIPFAYLTTKANHGTGLLLISKKS